MLSGALWVAVVSVKGIIVVRQLGGAGTWVQTGGRVSGREGGGRLIESAGKLITPVSFDSIGSKANVSAGRGPKGTYHPLCTSMGDLKTVAPSVLTYTALWESPTARLAILFGKKTASRCGYRASSLFARPCSRQHEVLSKLSRRLQDSRLSAAGQRACCLEATSRQINTCVST